MRHFILLAVAALMMASAKADVQPVVEQVTYRTIEVAGQKFALVDTVVNDDGRRTACAQYVAKVHKEDVEAGSKLNVQIEQSCSDLPKPLALR